MPFFINDNGNIRNISKIYINDNSSIRTISKGYINDNGNIRQFYSSASAPTGMYATTTNSTSIIWAWSSSGFGINYDVYVSTSSTAPTSGTTPTSAAISSLTYTSSALTQGTIYYFWVRVSGSGNPWSTGVSGLTLLTPAFSGATATSTGFTFNLTNYNATYTWAISTTAGTLSPSIVTGNGTYTISGLAPGASATVTVSTTYGTEATGINSILGTAISPIIPSVIITSDTAVSPTSQTLGWSSTNQSSWRITQTTGPTSIASGPTAGSATSTTFTGLTPNGTQYSGSVVVFSSTGNSASAGFTFFTAYNPPTILSSPSLSLSGSVPGTIGQAGTSLTVTSGTYSNGTRTSSGIAVSAWLNYYTSGSLVTLAPV